MQGALLIGQKRDTFTSIRPRTISSSYLLPMYHEFVGSHESGDWIPSTELNHSVYIKNLKEGLTNE
ncbi:hypothetical protein EEL30_00375 (plasmid) [Brevibacillus laterosporus]|uniref:Uncharacterized protein n=1 Tax=Brevibacillus laterosporus TaxID=1465 RepID=A0A518V1W0_BRELA|nr:hypothetical protein EEL30_00375 [Brevibacillus laterosporus]